MSEFNGHILVVLRWLQNKDSVTKKELEINYHSAAAASAGAALGTTVADAYAAAVAAVAVADAIAAVAGAASNAAEYWIDETKHSLEAYFELTEEDRKAYEERAKYLNILGVNNE